MSITTFRFFTLGCKLNFAESSHLAHLLRNKGLVDASSDTQADVCILHSCSVTHEADKKNIQLLRRIRRENPYTTIILIGCYAQLIINKNNIPPAISKITDFVIGQKDKFALPDKIFDMIKEKQPTTCPIGDNITTVSEFDDAQSYEDRTRCFLKIQDGCDYHCSYCTIPLARGKSRNPSIQTLSQKAQQIINNGFKEIVLSGVNIGDFGKSTNETFIDLLQYLDNLPVSTPYRIRISSCEPNLLTNDIIDFVKNSNHFAPHFHLPLQSGSNDILKIMGRRYTREDFKDKITYINKNIPNAFIGIDCMVGVRGETDKIFADYVQFISDLPFCQLHVFTYSERADTRILSMPLESIPLEVRHTRNAILQDLSKQHLKDFYNRQEGKEATVLWENGRKNTEKIGQNKLMYGFTENYVRVANSYNANSINKFEKIIIHNKK